MMSLQSISFPYQNLKACIGNHAQKVHSTSQHDALANTPIVIDLFTNKHLAFTKMDTTPVFHPISILFHKYGKENMQNNIEI